MHLEIVRLKCKSWSWQGRNLYLSLPCIEKLNELRMFEVEDKDGGRGSGLEGLSEDDSGGSWNKSRGNS